MKKNGYIYIYTLKKVVKVLVAQLHLTLCDPHGQCGLPGFSVHGILQARILEWVTTFSRGSPQPRNQIRVSSIADRCFTI